MFNPFKTKYRICHYYTTSVDEISGATCTYDPHYEIEYRNLATILFDTTWKELTWRKFQSYDAKLYLQEYINIKYDRMKIHKNVMFEIEL